MKGKARRLLSWVCVLALCMSLLPVTALAAPTESGTQENPVTNTENQVTVNKWVSTDGDGNYRLNMEAYASNEVTSTTTTKPLDIVLVLDVSGSMDERLGEGSFQYTPASRNEWTYNNVASREYYYNDGESYQRVYARADYDGWWPFGEYTNFRLTDENDQLIPNSQKGDSADNVLYTGTLYTRTWSEGDTKLEAMKKAVNAFIDQVALSSDQHRISVVKFASEEAWYGYNDTKIVRGLTNTNESGVTTLKDDVDDLWAGGATRADMGLELAEDILDKNTVEGRDPKEVVVLFTDGEPTSGSSFEDNVAASAVNTAKEIKDDGVTIYTVGMFGSTSNEDVTNYMDGVSSNYPEATAVEYYQGRPYDSWQKLYLGKEASSDYYFTADSASDLESIFEGIAEDVTTSTLAVYPDKTAILSDTLSEYFDFPADMQTSSDVTVSYVKAKSVNDGKITWEKTPSELPEGSKNITVSENDGTITITGFDYYENAVTKNVANGVTTYSGGKLVVSFPIELDEAACVADTSITNDQYPTNSIEEDSRAGLEYKENKDAEANNASTLLDKSPTVYYDKESYDANGTDVTVQVYVDGIPVMDPYNYVSLFRNSGNTSYTYWKATLDSDSGIITCDFDYYTGEGYDCVDIDVTLTNQAYVLQGIQSFQSYGSSGTKNVTPGTNKWTIDNVTAVGNENDPDVKIYLRTKYNVKYYVDGTESTTIQDNGVYIENEDVKTTSTDADKPETGENTWMSWKDTDLKTSITVKELPQNTQTEVYSGWWLNDSAMTGEPIVPNTSIAVSNAKPEGTTITFYGQANTPTADYTVKYEFLGENGEIDGSVTINDNDWNEDTSFPEGGDAEVGGTAEVSPSNTVTKTDGDNYVLVSTNHSCTIDVDSSKNVITVTYALDNWKDSEDGDTETGGDEIPDYQQALIKYVSNENGSVAPQLDVITLSQKDDNNKYSGEATASSKATAKKGYAFDYWMKDSSTDWKGWDPDLSDNFTAQGGQTYTYTANFAEDKNGDGTPDKYQVFVNFVSADENQGTVFDKDGAATNTGTTQVYTFENHATSGDVTPSLAGVDVKAKEGFAFDIWTKTAPATDTDTGVNPAETLEDIPGNTTITFYANFDTDEIGTEDPDKGDGIPDKYEATVTYKVVGGTWSDGASTADIKKVFDLKTYDETTGQWNPADPEPTLGASIPTGMKPSTGYVESGASWNQNINGSTPVTGNVTYTYTFPEANPGLTVVKEADETYVNVGEDIHYTVTVENTGDVALEDVKVIDILWKDGDVISVQVGESDPQNYEVADGSVTIPEIPVGDSAKIIYTYTTTKTGVLQTKVKP